MSKPDLSVIEGGKVELYEPPERHDFACWKCGKPCVLHPRNGNATMHSEPTCEEWQRIEKGKEDVERFLIKSRVPIVVMKGESS